MYCVYIRLRGSRDKMLDKGSAESRSRDVGYVSFIVPVCNIVCTLPRDGIFLVITRRATIISASSCLGICEFVVRKAFHTSGSRDGECGSARRVLLRLIDNKRFDCAGWILRGRVDGSRPENVCTKALNAGWLLITSETWNASKILR